MTSLDEAVTPGPSSTEPETGGLSPRSQRLIVVGILAFLFLLPLRGLLRNQGPPMEEGFMLVFPERVLKGALPNRDFLHLYGPGSLWALAATYWAFGTRLVVERLFALAQMIGVVAGVYLLARRWGRLLATGCAVVSLIVIVPPIGLTALAWVGGVALAVLALVAALASAERADERSGRRFALVGGVLAGLALLFRLDLVLAVGLGGLVVWRALDRARRRPLLGGLALGLAPYLVHLATAGPVTVFKGMVLDPVIYLRGGRRLPIPPPPSHLAGFLQRAGELRKLAWPIPTFTSAQQLTIWFFLLIGAIALLLVTGFALRRREPDAFRGRVLLASAALGLGMLPQALQRTDSTHFAWVSCVPLALLPIGVVEAVRLVRPGRVPRHLPLGAALLGVAIIAFVIPRWTLLQYTDYSLQTFDIHRQAYKIERNGRVFYYGRPDVAAQLRPLIAELSKISHPGQSLLVGTEDLRKTPYSDAFLYYLFPELTPATYYIEMDPGVANGPHSKLTSEVQKADFLILSGVWNDWSEPNDSEKFGSNAPNDVVQKDFCLVGDYGGLYELYRRCDLPGPSAGEKGGGPARPQ